MHQSTSRSAREHATFKVLSVSVHAIFFVHFQVEFYKQTLKTPFLWNRFFAIFLRIFVSNISQFRIPNIRKSNRFIRQVTIRFELEM